MKYINSDKLITEIERRIDLICTTEGIVKRDRLQEYETLRDIEDFIDSLQQEQPEVDLEKEVSNYLKTHHLHIKDGGRVVFDNDDSPNFMCDIRDIARHFYELGLNARKEE